MDSVLLERSAEVARLADAVLDAADGSGSVALVTGEAGIGKSSLIRAFENRIGDSARVLLHWADDATLDVLRFIARRFRLGGNGSSQPSSQPDTPRSQTDENA